MSKKPYRINVGFIVHEEVGYSHEFAFSSEKANFSEDLEVTNFDGTLEIGRTAQGLVVTGNFEGDITLECARCLNDFTHTISWDITELFAFKPEMVDDESVLPLPDSAQIDFGPILREYALLEVPINPLHAPDCKGLCLECGQDLNVEDCGHKDVDENSPFSVLKDLK